MSENPKEPREYDAVLGGQNITPPDAVILGGIAGVKSRLASPVVEVRIAALSEALKYGEAGLDLIIQSLQDDSIQVEFAAYSLLKARPEQKIKQHLVNHSPIFEFDVVTVDERGRENSRTKSWSRFFAEDLGNGISLEMVYIPEGKFLMGVPEGETYSAYRERPQHQVSVKPFFMGKYQITQAQWQAVAKLPKIHYNLSSNPSHFKGENRPVENVSWYDAVECCARLSQKTGNSYRLPSEAEWEYACRAGTSTPFHFGERITIDLANYEGYDTYAAGPKGIFREETTPVGSFGVANAFGLYDMHGNVWEWCADPWHDSYQGAPDDGTVWDENCNDNRYHNCIDLLVNTREDNRTRLLRGGSWGSNPRNCRSAIRDINIAPDYRSDGGGFRVACAVAWT